MPTEMPRGVPFSVDTWTPSSRNKRHHFLTHAHKDHSTAIVTHSSYPIYSTTLTKTLLLQQHPQLDASVFVRIEVGQSIAIDDPDGNFMVTAFDANHCPGAVMFLFEGIFGSILHTGDCRLTPEYLQCLPERYVGKKGKGPKCPLDFVFLDCTFGRSSQTFPSKHAAIQQVINCIWKHPDAPVVYLTCDLLGQEEILVNVAQAFGSKIYVDKDTNAEYFQALTLIAPEILSRDPSSRFQLFDGFPKLSDRASAKLAEARAKFQPEPLIVRPSTQWYVCEDENSSADSQRKLKVSEAVRDEFGIWHVCYSMHSSREELEWALQLLAPKWVISTTPPCRAMELSYVKKHCVGSKLASDDALWKLLDITFESSDVLSVKYRTSEPTPPSVELLPQPVNVSCSPRKLTSLSPPSKKPHVTLFGRARLGILDSNLPGKEKIISWNEGKHSLVVINEFDQKLSLQKENLLDSEIEIDVTEAEQVSCEKSVICVGSSNSTFGSSKTYSESMRRLYRSMNVSVPRPLPSLVELMNSRKRSRGLQYYSA